MKIIKKTIIIIEIIILLIMSLLNTVSISKPSIPGYELTDEEKQIEVGKWIRDFAISFTNAANNVKYGEITGAKDNKYYQDSSYTSNQKQLIMYSMNYQRLTAYNYFLKGSTQMATKFYRGGWQVESDWYITSNHKLAFDCSSFISFLYKYTANIDLCAVNYPCSTSYMRIHYDKYHNKNNCSCGCIYVGKLQWISNSELRAGDIIVEEGHVMMFNRAVNNEYVKVVDCGVGSTSNPNIGIGTEKDRSRSGTYGLVTKNAIIIRISKTKAVDIYDKCVNDRAYYNNHFTIASITFPGEVGGTTPTDPSTPSVPTDPSNPSEPSEPQPEPEAEYEYDISQEQNGEWGKADFFYYNGLPKKLEVSYHGNFLKKLFEVLSNILDYLLGIGFLAIKIQVVGWVGIAAKVINNVVVKIEGGLKTTENGLIDISDIIFNRIPILDIDFFNFKKAGGKIIDSSSIIYKLRKTISQWYYALFIVCAIGLLLTLIYIGIRMAISTIAERKAKYKRMLQNWILSVVILFTLHFFMVAVIYINQAVLDIMAIASGDLANLDTELFGMIMQLKASASIPGTIVFVALVIYSVKFLLIYFKRLLNLAILTLIAPVIAIAYSIDKIKDGKSQSLGAWMKEYVYNVFLQMIHAIVYAIFIGFIFDIIRNGGVFDLIPNIVLILVTFNFMLKAEEIMRKIFRIEGGSSNVGDIASQTLKGAITGITGASFAGKVAKGYISGVGKVAGSAATKAAELVGTAGLLGTKYKNAYKADREESNAIKTPAREDYNQAREIYARARRAEEAAKNAYTGAVLQSSQMGNHFIDNNYIERRRQELEMARQTAAQAKQRFESSKRNYGIAKQQSKKIMGRTVGVARAEANVNVEKFKKNLKHQIKYVGKDIKSGATIVTKYVNATLAIPFMAVSPKVGMTMLFSGVVGGGRLKRLNASIKGYKKALSKEQPPKEVMDKFISDYKKKNNGREPSQDEINDFIKKYQDKQIKRYKLTYITSSALTLGLTDELLEQVEINRKDKKKEDKKVKAGNEAVCTARQAEMIISAKIQELKQEDKEKRQNEYDTNPIQDALDDATREELKQKMKEAFESNTSKEAIKKLVKEKSKNNSLNADEIRNIMQDLGLEVDETSIADFEKAGDKSVDAISNYIYNGIKENRHNSAGMKRYAEVFEQMEILKDANDKIKEVLGKSLYGNVDDLIDTIINL
ncbi:MAG: hypothetical protein Q4C39_05875 [Clostridia bacterium]|nr:hypothetical protein [Clostridia bacterium]